MTALYDDIGRSYRDHRRPEPRIAAYIEDALADARTVVNVGAGTGSYESSGRTVVAVEPSLTMIRQRGNGPVVQSAAETIPFPDKSFDAATAFITIHHWSDWRAGLAEMGRVATRVLVLGIDPVVLQQTWIMEYFSSILGTVPDPTVEVVVEALGGADVVTIPTPHDCIDGFLLAYWRRPEAYLDPSVRACISGFARHEEAVFADGLRRLADDLESGAWHKRHADLLELETYDTGLRLLVAG